MRGCWCHYQCQLYNASNIELVKLSYSYLVSLILGFCFTHATQNELGLWLVQKWVHMQFDAHAQFSWGHKLMYDILFSRLNLLISNNHITAFVEHHTGKILVCASTKEFSIARHLWRTNDVSAAINIGRVIAQRCKETGIERVFWWMKSEKKKERVIFLLVAEIRQN